MMELKSAGLDWLTMTTSDDGLGGYWYEQFSTYARENVRKELGIQPFYNGYHSGVKCGKMSWGYKEGLGYILVVTGGATEEYYLRYYPALTRVTRVDLRMDVVVNEPRDVAGKWFDVLKTHGNRQRGYRLWENDQGGKTLYVGSRNSQQYGRIYDKGVEAGLAEPGLLWRLEVEYKKPIANQVYGEVVNLPVAERVEKISGTVANWFESRGVAATIGMVLGEGITMQLEFQATTLDRKINWLRTQVRPTVRRLVDAGYGRDVFRALLLDERELEHILKNPEHN